MGIVRDNVVFYGKGSVAFANAKHTTADVDGSLFDPAASVSTSKTRVGWAAGGGIEYGLTPQWSIRAEYLYLGFGNFSQTDLQGGVYTFSRNHVHTGTVGINYRFGGPVVARY
jgi:outer membrane immunogenic protein